jgi:hypothetical protein
MSEKSVKSIKNVYQIKITLRDSKPPIWRRLLVPDSINLYKLHQVIQIAMGWTDSHLHQFIIQGKYYGIPSPEDWTPVIDERRFHLNKIAPSEGNKFIYEYDFGDSWEVEKRNLPRNSFIKVSPGFLDYQPANDCCDLFTGGN